MDEGKSTARGISLSPLITDAVVRQVVDCLNEHAGDIQVEDFGDGQLTVQLADPPYTQICFGVIHSKAVTDG